MITKLVKFMGVFAILLFVSNPAFAAGSDPQNTQSIRGATQPAKIAPIQTHCQSRSPMTEWSRVVRTPRSYAARQQATTIGIYIAPPIPSMTTTKPVAASTFT